MGQKIFHILAGVAFIVSRFPVRSDVSSFITLMEQIASTSMTYDCTLIQSLLGATYHQMDNKTEPTPDNVSLVLYTTNENVIYYKTYFKLSAPTSLLRSCPKFDVNLPITIFIHGFGNTQENQVVKEITAALLKRGGTNVLTLDPGLYINGVYVKSTTHVLFIGEMLGIWLVDFVKGGGIRPRIHLIGHSLGAHIAGLSGKIFYALTWSKIPRITGLDPAGPCFYSSSYSHRLWYTDADFVDVIHSNGGVLGLFQPLGHVDFYLNNGKNQPNGLIIPESHRRSWKTYIESIYYPANFPATLCRNWVTFLSGTCSSNPKAYMGYDLPSTARGLYFLRTNDSPLYGMGDKGSRPDDNIFRAFSDWLNAVIYG